MLLCCYYEPITVSLVSPHLSLARSLDASVANRNFRRSVLYTVGRRRQCRSAAISRRPCPSPWTVAGRGSRAASTPRRLRGIPRDICGCTAGLVRYSVASKMVLARGKLPSLCFLRPIFNFRPREKITFFRNQLYRKLIHLA